MRSNTPIPRRRFLGLCAVVCLGILIIGRIPQSCAGQGNEPTNTEAGGQQTPKVNAGAGPGQAGQKRLRRRPVTGPSQVSWVLNSLPTPAPARPPPEPASTAFSFAQRALNGVVTEDGRRFYARQIPNPTPLPIVYPPTPAFNTHRNLPRLNCTTSDDAMKFPQVFEHALPPQRFAIRASEDTIGGSQITLEVDADGFPDLYFEMLYLLGYSHWEDVYESSATMVYDMRGRQVRAVEMPANPRFRAIKRINSTAQITMSWYMFHPIAERYGIVNHHGDYRHHVNGTPPVAWVSAGCIHSDVNGDISCALHKALIDELPLNQWNAAACHHDLSYNQRTNTYVALCHYADSAFAQEFALDGSLLKRMTLFQETDKEQHFNSIYWYDDPTDKKRSLLLVNDYFRGMYLYDWDTQEMLWFISPTTMKAASDAYLPKLFYNADVEITRKLHDVQPLPDGRFIGFANLPRAGWLIFRVEFHDGKAVGLVERAFLANHGQGAIGAVSMLPDGNVMCLWCPPPSPVGGRCEAAVTTQNYNVLWWGVVQLQRRKLMAMAFRFTPFYMAPLVAIEQEDTPGMAFCVNVRTAQMQRQWGTGCVVVEDEKQGVMWSEKLDYPPLWQRTRFCVPSTALTTLTQRPSNVMWRLRVWDPQACAPASIAIMGGTALLPYAEAQQATSTCVTSMQCPSNEKFNY